MYDLLSMITSAIAVAFAIVVHESAHALAAYLLGDNTARERGRISFNPLAHIDPFGTVILPLLMIAAGGPVFAFAKPVPVYLGNLKHPKRDEILVSLAGPASNILLALLATLLLHAFGSMPASIYVTMGTGAIDFAVLLFVSSISVNLSLAFFNLIPIPPFDGSSLLVPFLKGKALRTYYELQRYTMPILIVVLYLLPSVLHIDLIDMYFSATVDPLFFMLLRFALG
nr:site-2 protease family protein [Collinsella provencensis]